LQNFSITAATANVYLDALTTMVTAQIKSLRSMTAPLWHTVRVSCNVYAIAHFRFIYASATAHRLVELSCSQLIT
jgi:hypothetical protein